MNSYDFKKEDFASADEGRYRIEFDKNTVGNGADLTVEELLPDGTYSPIQAEIIRFNEQIFIEWSTPFDGRITTDIKY